MSVSNGLEKYNKKTTCIRCKKIFYFQRTKERKFCSLNCYHAFLRSPIKNHQWTYIMGAVLAGIVVNAFIMYVVFFM
jgi:hypothetical protein